MLQLHWYALYVRSRSEKIVNLRISEKGIETYLPLQKTLRQWHDRKKLVELPLFNSYIFVHANSKQFHTIKETEGVAGFVTFEGVPAKIPDDQINYLKLLLDSSEKFEVSYDVFEFGDSVEVYRGPLKGFKGLLVNYKGRKRALLQIEAINQSLLVEIHLSNLKKVDGQNSIQTQ